MAPPEKINMLDQGEKMKPAITFAVMDRCRLAFISVLAATTLLAADKAPGQSAPAEAAKSLNLPAIFGDHMVLQRDGVAPIWGTATPGDAITVTAGAVSGTATADAGGKWIVRLAKLPVSDTPISVKVQGPKDTIVFNDVLVGDVWFASGQSNMELGINLDSLVKAGKKPENNPLIRTFVSEPHPAAVPTEKIHVNKGAGNGIWKSGHGGGRWGMGVSAVGYYFVRDIQAFTRHPVGLIQSASSGSVAETWLSREALAAEASLGKHAEKALKMENDFKEGKNPKVSEMYSASANFNGGVNPYIPYGLKGVIWYQGESNSAKPAEYRILLPALIKDWRTRWGQDFSFMIVQLPTGVPEMAQAQAYIAAMPNNGLCVTYDIGAGYSVPEGNSRVHPNYKSGVGIRLALAARKVAYGDDKAVCTGPTCQKVTIDGSKIRVKFDNVGSGLVIGMPPADWYPKEPRVSTDALLGFELAGADGKYVPATAAIDGTDVVVSSPNVANPALVRYCWNKKDIRDGKNNLYNKEGLPAAPFRSDELFPVNNPAAATGKTN
jgi:sialate O-acetylesterase